MQLLSGVATKVGDLVDDLIAANGLPMTPESVVMVLQQIRQATVRLESELARQLVQQEKD